MELAALAVLTLAAGGAFWLSRTKDRSFSGFLKRAGGEAGLRVVSRLHLTPHHSLHLVDTGEGRLLVGCSPQGITALRETPAARSRTAVA